MFVMKRDGRKEAVAFDKITARISNLCYGLNPKYVEPVIIAQKVRAVVIVLLFLSHPSIPPPHPVHPPLVAPRPKPPRACFVGHIFWATRVPIRVVVVVVLG